MPSSTNEYECSVCSDQGVKLDTISYNELGHKVERWIECECEQKRRMKRVIEFSEITDEFRAKTFKTFDPSFSECASEALKRSQEAYKVLKGINLPTESSKGSIALLGRPGTGKTHMSMAIANALIERGVFVLYAPYVETMSKLKSNLDKVESIIHHIKTSHILYIDDLFKGTENLTPFERSKVFEIINYRYLNKLPLIISSERSAGELCAMDEAIGSRIVEMCTIVKMKGGIEVNYRLKDLE